MYSNMYAFEDVRFLDTSRFPLGDEGTTTRTTTTKVMSSAGAATFLEAFEHAVPNDMKGGWGGE